MKIYSVLYNARFAIIKLKLVKSYLVAKDIIKNQITYYPDSVRSFEEKFSKYIGTNYCLTFCNGTSSLEAALFALNLPNNSKIGLPSCTFHSDIDAVKNSQCIPFFIDIEEESTSISMNSLKSAVQEGIKALIVPHLFGIVKNIDEIAKICKSNHIHLIEDCSHAHGASYKGKMAGSYGDISFFSLQGAKPISAGEGGAALTNDKKYFVRMSAYSHFGRHSLEYDNGLLPYSATGIGHKHRAHPLGIRLALVDLARLDDSNNVIRKNFAKIADILDNNNFFVVRPDGDGLIGGVFSGLHFINKTNLSTEYICQTFNDGGINVSLYPYQIHHMMKIYGANSSSNCDNTDKLATKLLFLDRRYLEYLPRFILRKLSLVLGKIENEISQ